MKLAQISTLPGAIRNSQSIQITRTFRFISGMGFGLFLLLSQNARATGSTNLVIAEIYGGGGNSGALYRNDFVVLFNRGHSYQDTTGWSLQYQSQGSSNWTVINLTNTLIQPGGYHLVALGSFGPSGAFLPTPDTIFVSLNISATAGKMALVNDSIPLSTGCPNAVRIQDKVGYGTNSVFCNETTNAPAPSNTNSIQRKFSGCKDTDNNAHDFVLGYPSPRNSGSFPNTCPSGNRPDVLAQSQDQFLCVGNTATFYVEVDGDESMVYFWYSNDIPVFDGIVSTPTNSYLTITNVQLFDSRFYVQIYNNAGYTNSSTNHLFVSVVPQQDVQPVNQFVSMGQTIQFNVTAFPPPLTYGWWFEGKQLTNDGLRVFGADSPDLMITGAQLGDAGYYRAVISNSCFTLTSVAAQCHVGPVPVITNELISQVVPFKTNVQFAVGATGPLPLFYQWYRNDVSIPGATSHTLTLTNVQRPEVGVYHVVVHDANGATVSERAHLQVELTLDGNILYREEATDYVDSLTNALRLFALPPTVLFRGPPLMFTTYDATTQPWETARCDVPPSHSMWILYNSPVSRVTRISTEGSDFDTVVAV